MIRFVHRNSKLITYVFLFVAVCFMISGVGLDILHDGNSGAQDYAIQVNDTKISMRDFERTKENINERYRSMFGDQYESVVQQFKLNVSQQTIDGLIDTTLLNEESEKWGLTTSEESVKKFLVTKIFAGKEISNEAVREYLQNLGMTYKQFSKEVREQLSRQALTDILRDVSFVGPAEIESQYIEQETTFSLNAATISAEQFAAKVPEPSEEALKKLYDSTATTYDLPARVSYEYLAFQPKDFEKDVQVLGQDVEFYYSENPNQFRTPEQIHVRSIKILYPKESKPEAMAAARAKAQKAHDEAVTGKPFAELVQQYSEDLPSKLVGGDKGWITRGAGSKKFEEAAFNAPIGTVAALIEEDYGFEIVHVDEKRESSVKPLEQVKAQIEESIRKREAPSYAAAKAREVVELTKKNSTSIAEVAKTMGLSAPKEAILSQEGQDPDPLLRGLTQQAMQVPAAERLIATVIDAGDTSVALQIREFKEPTTPSFEDVRERVLAAYKKDEAKNLATTSVRELLEAVQKDPAALESLAKARGFTVAPTFTISRATPTSSDFPGLSPEMRNDAFAVKTAPSALPRFYVTSTGLAVATVSRIDRPDPKAAKAVEALPKYKEQAADESSRTAMATTLALLKSQATIDIDKNLLLD
jgi:parvulin-like peptidyl-prolyl isomerase